MLVPSSTPPPPSNVPQNSELTKNIFQVVKILIINYYNHNLLVSISKNHFFLSLLLQILTKETFVSLFLVLLDSIYIQNFSVGK